MPGLCKHFMVDTLGTLAIPFMLKKVSDCIAKTKNTTGNKGNVHPSQHQYNKFTGKISIL